LHVRSGHVELRAPVCGSSSRGRSEAALVGSHFSSQAVLGQLNGIGTAGAEELVDVVRQHVGVRQHRVVRRIVFCSGLDDGMGVLQLLLNGLQLLGHLSGLTRLRQQSIFHHAGVAVQQGRSFSAEVLEDFKTFAADVLQILVAGGRALLAAVARRLCRQGLGIGLRLWER